MSPRGLPTAEEIAAIENPRERLLAAAATVLHEGLFDVVCDGLRPEEVTRVAGRSRRVFYDHFGDRADVLRGLALAYLEPNSGLLAERSGDLSFAFDVVEGDLIDGATLLVGATFDETLASARPAMRMLAWCVGRNDPVIGDAYRRHHAVSDAFIGDMLERLNAAVGLRFRPPWTGEKASITMRALADGLYLRHQLEASRTRADGTGADPGSGDRAHDELDVTELFTMTALSLLPVATQPAGTPDVAVADHLADFAEALSAAWREGVDVDQLLDARERVLQALRETVTALGPTIDLDAVALTAGLSMRSVVAAFGTLAELVEAAVDESLPQLGQEAAFDLAAGDIGIEDMVRRHLLRVGQWARTEPQLARLWLASATGAVPAIGPEASHRFSQRLAEPLRDMLDEAHRQRATEPDPMVGSTSAMATNVLLGRMTAGRDFDLDQSAQWLTDVVIRTLRLD